MEEAYQSIPGNLFDNLIGGGPGLESVPPYILNELSRLEDTANATNKILTAISGYVNSGAITEEQARELGRKYGLEL